MLTTGLSVLGLGWHHPLPSALPPPNICRKEHRRAVWCMKNTGDPEAVPEALWTLLHETCLPVGELWASGWSSSSPMSGLCHLRDVGYLTRLSK